MYLIEIGPRFSVKKKKPLTLILIQGRNIFTEAMLDRPFAKLIIRNKLGL